MDCKVILKIFTGTQGRRLLLSDGGKENGKREEKQHSGGEVLQLEGLIQHPILESHLS